MIENLQAIGATAQGKVPIMSITSGHTHIYFDGKYQLDSKKIDHEERRIIAFNTDNDLNKPPDENNVRVIHNNFPGTVISMKFFIEKENLVKLSGGKTHEN